MWCLRNEEKTPVVSSQSSLVVKPYEGFEENGSLICLTLKGKQPEFSK